MRSLVLVGSLTLAIGSVYSHWAGAVDTSPDAPLLRVTTQVLQIESGYSVQRAYTGEVRSRRRSELGFERSGELVEIFVSEGQRVAAGTVIARLDSRSLGTDRANVVAQLAAATAHLAELQAGPRTEVIAAASATVQDIQNQLDLAMASHQRLEALYREGAIAQQQLDETAYAVGSLEARLVSVQQQQQELQTGTRPEQITAQQARVASLEATVASLDIALSKSEIVAPYSGQIAQRYQNEGTVIAPGQPVVRLVETDSWEAYIGIPVDTPLPENLNLNIGNHTYSASSLARLPEIDPVSRTVSLRLSFSTPATHTLHDGQTARLYLDNRIETPGYWLPLTALIPAERGLWQVYGLDAEQRVIAHRVEVLHSEGERVFVQGTLQPGTRIIPAGNQRLVPGQQVITDV